MQKIKIIASIIMVKNRKFFFDAVILACFIIIATVVTVVFKTNFLTSTVLFFVFPSLYLSYRDSGIIKKSAFFSLLFTVPLTTFLDYMAVLDRSWFVPNTVFGSRLFGVVPYEDYIWAFFFVYLIVLFYEYFLDHGEKRDRLQKNIIYMILLFNSLLAVFFLLLKTDQDLLHVEYFYLKGGIVVAVIPLVLVLLFFPELWKKCFTTVIYFSPLFLSFELSGLYANQWEFNEGKFVGLVGISRLRFPVEELFFWIILGSVWILSYYEYFADDRK